MNLDSQLDEYARALKKRRIDSLAREIDSELCRTIRGGYVSYTRAERAAQSFSRTIKIPYEFAYRMMLDYARGKYCSYDAASYYSQMMAERIISKYEIIQIFKKEQYQELSRLKKNKLLQEMKLTQRLKKKTRIATATFLKKKKNQKKKQKKKQRRKPKKNKRRKPKKNKRKKPK